MLHCTSGVGGRCGVDRCLVRKGILTQKEAEKIQAEVNQEAAQAASQQPNSPNSVLKIGNWVNELDLYGDLRLRNYYQNTQAQLPRRQTRQIMTTRSSGTAGGSDCV